MRRSGLKNDLSSNNKNKTFLKKTTRETFTGVWISEAEVRFIVARFRPKAEITEIKKVIEK